MRESESKSRPSSDDRLERLRGLLRASKIEQRLVGSSQRVLDPGREGPASDQELTTMGEKRRAGMVGFYVIDSRKVEAILGGPA